MHNLYKQNAADPVSITQYRRIFETNFNYGFHVPKKDKCGTCEGFKNMEILSEEEKDKQDRHLQMKESARCEKDKDKERRRGKGENWIKMNRQINKTDRNIIWNLNKTQRDWFLRKAIVNNKLPSIWEYR